MINRKLFCMSLYCVLTNFDLTQTSKLSFGRKAEDLYRQLVNYQNSYIGKNVAREGEYYPKQTGGILSEKDSAMELLRAYYPKQTGGILSEKDSAMELLRALEETSLAFHTFPSAEASDQGIRVRRSQIEQSAEKKHFLNEEVALAMVDEPYSDGDNFGMDSLEKHVSTVITVPKRINGKLMRNLRKILDDDFDFKEVLVS